MGLQLHNGRIDSLFPSLRLPIDVLRLDTLHPVVSGNKWFKLKYYLQQAKEEKKSTLLTWGGAYSNHIVATAFAARSHDFKSIGIIRGEEPETWSHTLAAAKKFGMEIHFVSRYGYRQKQIPEWLERDVNWNGVMEIPEGGSGLKGAEGAKEILNEFSSPDYTHIISAVGTGTTLAGLCLGIASSQKVIGIPVLKNAYSLSDEIDALLPNEKKQCFQLVNNYHFGGYAKHTAQLIEFMNEFYLKTGIPTDFVYTAKALYGAIDLYEQGYFPKNSKVLVLHTGGLQGNLSLPNGTLIFGQTKS